MTEGSIFAIANETMLYGTDEYITTDDVLVLPFTFTHIHMGVHPG